jgi:putative transposase
LTVVFDSLEVSRSHLRESLRKEPILCKNRPGKKPFISDDEILHRIKSVVAQRPRYRYRRACAVLNRALLADGLPKANHKRI